jgi:hypothetical protein
MATTPRSARNAAVAPTTAEQQSHAALAALRADDIPPALHEPLLRTVLRAMLLRDAATSAATGGGGIVSLHRRAAAAVEAVLSEEDPQRGMQPTAPALATTNANAGASRSPTLRSFPAPLDGLVLPGGGAGATVGAARAGQMDALLADAQAEAAALRRQLADMQRAHDDAQTALSRAFTEYDALQQHVLVLSGERDQALRQQQQLLRNQPQSPSQG